MTRFAETSAVAEAHPAPWGSILCDEQGRCVDGICRKDVPLGEPCDGRGCVGGSYCSSVESACVPWVEAGGVCGRTTELDLACEPGLVCATDEGSGERRCTTFEQSWCARAY